MFLYSVALTETHRLSQSLALSARPGAPVRATAQRRLRSLIR